MNDLKKTASHWNERTELSHGRNLGIKWWEAGSSIQEYINRRITGNPQTDWISYTLGSFFQGKQFSSTSHLSLGCGTGRLERTIAQKIQFQRFDAYDIADSSIQIARAEAEVMGLNNIHYYVADVNSLNLPPNTYDAVWIHAALHHLTELENVCVQISKTLKADGILILQEYIGPDRFQFPARQKEIANLCLQLMPTQYRAFVREAVNQEMKRVSASRGIKWFASKFVDKIRDGDFWGAVQRQIELRKAVAQGQTHQKNTVSFPTARSVIAIDPSEAVRSSEIVSILQNYFKIVERKDWGGNVLQFLLAGIAGNFANGDPQSAMLLRMLINIEETLLECGEYESDFAYIVARPLR